MGEVLETTNTGGKTVTKFFSGFLTPQMALIILTGAAGLVIFWKNTTENWSKTKEVEEAVKIKADKAEVDARIKSTDDKVNRMYERFSKVDDKITVLEKQREYDKGFHDGEKEEKRDQRREAKAAQ